MYAGVPTTWVSPLACSIAFGDAEVGHQDPVPSVAVERSRRFGGLMSRWMTPWACSTATPRRPGRRGRRPRGVGTAHLRPPARQRALVGVRHHEVRRPVGLADVVDPDDVVGVGAAQDPGLLEEPLPDVEPLGPVVRERLHGDVGAQLVIVVEPDGREAAHPETVDPLETTETLGEGHAGYCAADPSPAGPGEDVADLLGTGEPDLESLAQRAAAGDREALEELLAAIQPRVQRICGRMLLYPEDAEEAAQDALMLVATKIGAFEGRPSSPPGCTPWRPTAPARPTAPSSGGPPSDHRRAAAHADPRTTSVIAGSRLDLLEALDVSAPTHPDLVEPLVLRDVQELEYADIAAAAGHPARHGQVAHPPARQAVRPLLRVTD